jgi:hypothetical protein
MKTLKIEKATLIPCKGFMISIGTHSTSEIAIISKTTGEFAHFKDIRKGGRLAKIKRKFKAHLCSTIDLCFSGMSDSDTFDLITMLK